MQPDFFKQTDIITLKGHQLDIEVKAGWNLAKTCINLPNLFQPISQMSTFRFHVPNFVHIILNIRVKGFTQNFITIKKQQAKIETELPYITESCVAYIHQQINAHNPVRFSVMEMSPDNALWGKCNAKATIKL